MEAAYKADDRFLPCIIMEKGIETLEEWMKRNEGPLIHNQTKAILVNVKIYFEFKK